MIQIRTILAGCLVGAVLTACAGTRPGTVEVKSPDAGEIIVGEITYDDKGLPLVGPALADRPSLPGDHFTLVRMSGTRPVISYDIVVVSQKPDFSKPVEAVYAWTGKGFRIGLEATGVLVRGNVQTHNFNGDGAALAAAVVLAPMAVGTVGGFVIGVVDGIRHTALELGKFVLDADEQVVTCTRYEYDLHGRLLWMRMFSPDQKQELVRTEFMYAGLGPNPVRSTVRSFPEGKDREVR